MAGRWARLIGAALRAVQAARAACLSVPIRFNRGVCRGASMLAGAVILWAALGCSVHAASGDLDATFGTGGKVLTSFGRGNNSAYGVAIQPDGKIVAAGYAYNGDISAFAVARYNTDGTLDTNFGVGGKVMTAVGTGTIAQAFAVALQSDGKIVAVGRVSNTGTGEDFGVVRYNSNGTLDATFGSGGKVTTSIGAGNDWAKAVAIQADGKIVVAGYSPNPTQSDFALVRYTASGALDAGFGSGGIVITPVGTTGSDVAEAVVIDSNGKIYAAGYALGATTTDFALVRYTSAGALDTTFNGTGKVLTPIGTSTDFGSAAVLDSNGKIVVAGTSSSDVAVARYNTDGTLDTTFNGTGKVITVSAGSDSANAVAIDSLGNIVVAGRGPNAEFILLRYTPAGLLDTSFNGTGKVSTTVSQVGLGGGAQTVAIQADGKIVAAGDSWSGSSYDAQLVRYTSAGALDTTFGGTGKVATDQGSSGDVARAVALQPDGKIVAVGSSYDSTGQYTEFAVARLNADGALDTSFGCSSPPCTGTVTTYITGTGSHTAYAVAVQPDGKIVVAGDYFYSPTWAFFLARYNANGTLDTTFDTDGKVTTDIRGSVDVATAVALQTDGKIVAAGYSYDTAVPANYDFAVVRYTSTGALDTTFNGTGKVTTPIGTGEDVAQAVAIDANGEIVVAGYSYDTSTLRYKFAVVRYTSTGALDNTFGSGGKVTTFVGTTAFGLAIAIQSDGKIVVAGSSNSGATDDFALVRYNADGTVDTSFGTGGKVITVNGTGHDVAQSIALQPDGKIIVAGYLQNTGGSGTDMRVARYLPDGSPDTGFGSGGFVAIANDPGVNELDTAYAVAIQTDGSIVVGGVLGGYFGVARLSVAFDTQAPTVPAGLTATAVSSSQINLSWTASNDNVGVTAYQVFRGGVFRTTVNAPTVTFSDTGLTASTVYSYTVAACDAAGNCSAQSASASAITPAAGDTTPPSVPFPVIATAVSSSQINLRWNASTDNVGVTAYQVFRGGVFRTTVNAPALSFSDTGLTASTSYSYTVAACDAAGNCSAQSSAAAATTLAPGQYAFNPELELGFNLIGNSLNITLDVVAIFGNQDVPTAITSNIVSIWKWNAVDGRWAFYSPQLTAAANASYAASHSYELLSIINPGEGYWVNAILPMSLPAQMGSAFNWNGINFANLTTGFNLIAHAGNVTPSQFNNDVSPAPPSPGVIPTTNFVSLWAWDAVVGNWYFYSPLLESSGGLAAVKSYADTHFYLHFQDYNKTLDVGVGFWVNRP